MSLTVTPAGGGNTLTDSASLRTALSDENGTGVALFDSATNPTLIGLTSTGQILNSAAGAASTPSLKLSGVPFAGTGTTSFPLFYINDANATASTTLNTAGTYLGVNGDGTQDLINLLKDGTSQFKVSSVGNASVTGTLTVGSTTTFSSGNVTMGGGDFFTFSGRSRIGSTANGNLLISDNAVGAFTLLQLGGTTSSYPALKRSTTSIQGRLADDSAFCPVQAKLTTDTNATAGLTAGVLAALTNASIVLYDASGQAYRIPCII